MPDIRLMGVTYPDVPAVDLPQNGGGTARFYILNNQNKTVTPTESQQIITADSGYTGLGQVTVGAISDVYVGSGITRRTSSDLTASGRTVTAPAGYYESAATKQVQQGTEGTPTATKGAVSNHSITITPSVTNSAGYISGGTRTGTAVTVTAAELVSGTFDVSSAGTHDVANYEEVFIPEADANGSSYGAFVTQNGQRKWVLTSEIYGETAGWIDEGGSGASTRTYQAVASGTTVTPTTSSQTIGGANYMMEGAVTINPIPSQYIIPTGNLAITQNGNNIDVSQYATVSVNVSGGGGAGWTVWNGTLSDALYSVEAYIPGNPTAWIIYRSQSINSPASGAVAAILHDSSGTKVWSYTNGSAVEESDPSDIQIACEDYGGIYHFAVVSTNEAHCFPAGPTYDPSYGIICLYGGAGSIAFHTATYSPPSGVTSGQFTVPENPPIYLVGLDTSVAAASYHRVQTVVKSYDFGILSGTNFYTNTIGNYTDFTETYANGTLTVASSGTNGGGYFHNPGQYTLFYLLQEDLDGSSYQRKTVTPTTSQQVITADQGYEALSQVTVNAIPSQYIIPTGNLAITQNGNSINVSQYATVSVNVSGGGGATMATKSTTNSSATATSLTFTGMAAQPKGFFLRCTSSLTRSSNSTYYYVADIVYDGTDTKGNCYRMSNGNYANVTTGYSWTYSGTTLTITSSGSRTASPGSFYNGTYELVYTY